MKPLLTALALSVATTPAVAFGVDMGSVTPVLTFPEPAPEPVTQDQSGIDD